MAQEPFIFNSTVMHNVIYGRPDATEQEVHDACRKAGIHDLIMKRSKQYQTLTGENGR
jgi:ABC-type multidrug transport system fused ATPase/permease subunit